MSGNAEKWRARRDEQLAELEERAERLLVDRTVVHVKAVPHNDACDSPNVLRLTFNDGGVVDIEGTYAGYTGHSCDEYVEVVEVHEVKP